MFPGGFRLARISGNISQTASWIVRLPCRPLPPSLSLSLSLSLRLSLSSSPTQSPFPHTDAARHVRARFSVCMFCGWLCSDSRRSTRGYYIVKPFNYLGKLLPGIFAPACLNECTWLQAGWAGVAYNAPFPLAVCHAAVLPVSPLSLSLSLSQPAN